MITLREAKVIAVDPVKYTVDIQLSRTEGVLSGVPFASQAVARDGSWMGAMPTIGDWCLLGESDSRGRSYVLAFCPLASSTSVDPADGFSDATERDNFAYGREGATPGDKGMWSGVGGCIVLRAGGHIDLCVSDLCWTRYFPDQEAIRTNCVNWDLHGWWGSVTGETDRADFTDMEGSAPTRFKSRVRGRSNEAPVVWTDAGSIRGEEKTVLNGVPNQDPNAVSEVCFRMLVFDQQTANGYAALKQEPPAEQARFAFRVDKEGNVQVASAGMVDVIVKRLSLAVEERVFAQIRGTLDMLVQSARIVAEGKVLVQGRDETIIQTDGDLVFRARRVVIDAQNDVCRVRGPWGVDADGSVEMKSGGTMQIKSAQDMTVSVGQTRFETIGGRDDVTVLGSGEPTWAGRDVATWRRRIKSGAAVIHTETGSIDLRFGPALGPPISRIRVVADARNAVFMGRCEMVVGPIQNRITVDPNGSWMLGSDSLSSIRYTPGGSVQIGPVAGVPGFVVTTTSHRDYMTGLPLMGSPSVSVTSVLPGAPIPAPPVPPPLATPILPDELVS